MQNLGETHLQHVSYTVFGLGDSSYPLFNVSVFFAFSGRRIYIIETLTQNILSMLQVAAKRADVRLTALGAQKFLDIGLGDDSHPFGYEAALANWTEKLWKVLQNKFPLPSGTEEPRHSEIVERAQPAPISCEIEMRKTRDAGKQDSSLQSEEFGYEAWTSAKVLDSVTGRLVSRELCARLDRVILSITLDYAQVNSTYYMSTVR